MFKFLKKIIKIVIWLNLFFIMITTYLCVIFQFINPPTTPMILYRQITSEYKLKPREFIKFKNIPPRVVQMLLSTEDLHFYQHNGFEWEAVMRAFKVNQRRGKIRVGGSTITQQTARMIFLTSHRNYLRKYLEFIITNEMEALMSKNRILELYFNYTEWGRGIFGIESASQWYYHKSLQHISKENQMRLISILSNPIKYNPKNLQKSKTLNKRFRKLNEYY